MISFGWRPKGIEQHKAVVQFTGRVLGDDFKTLIRKFDRMRRKRHEFIYEPARPIPHQEAEDVLESARQFVSQILTVVKEKESGK